MVGIVIISAIAIIITITTTIIPTFCYLLVIYNHT